MLSLRIIVQLLAMCPLCLAQQGKDHPRPTEKELRAALQAEVNEIAAANSLGLQLSYLTPDYDITVSGGYTNTTAGKRPVQNRDTMLFGSGTKPLTATKVMMAHEAGLLHVNDTVASHIDEMFSRSINTSFSALFGPLSKNLTIWHLMSMQSGLPDFDVEEFDTEVLTTAYSRTWDTMDLVKYAATQPWVCAPGTCVYYSSSNYIILGYVLLKVQGGETTDEWPFLEQKSVLRKASHDYPLMKFADGHSLNESGLTTSGWSTYGGGVRVGGQSGGILGWTCGNMVGTTHGMAQFFWDLLVDKSIVSEKSLNLMKSFRTINKGWGTGHLNYGAGLFIQQTADNWTADWDPPRYGDWGTTIGHGGDTYGYLSDQGYIPQLNATWSYTGNTDKGGYSQPISCLIIKAAAKATLGYDPPIKCPPALFPGKALRAMPHKHHHVQMDVIV